ncbi:hypothetical protein [uncultured Methanolobus sp.]|uniref:hypothetical protein n=1 Tax=uncultured Methanolobus sp. TaxID=218300 RepID=UPI0029C9528D|nr:hypothetical protein [uncultured Methanolobus sp.]
MPVRTRQGVGVSETNTDCSSCSENETAVERHVQHVGRLNLSEGYDYQKAETSDDGNGWTHCKY